MRVLNFADGFESNEQPLLGKIAANNLLPYADDASYIAYKGDDAEFGDIYVNTTTKKIRYFDGTSWVNDVVQDDDGNVTLSGDIVAANLSGQNSGDTTLGDFDETPNPKGISIVGQEISLHAASATTPGLITTGTQTFAGEKTFNDPIVFKSTVEFIGPNVRVNAVDLDVKDQNIMINKGGTNASSEGAGFTVDRVGTKGKVSYDSTKTSRFKVGDEGSESEVLTVGHVQSISAEKNFTGKAIFSGIFELDEEVNATLTGSNQTLVATKTSVVLTNAGLISISQISGGERARLIAVINKTGNTVVVKRGSIETDSGRDLKFKNNALMVFVYSPNDSKWRAMGGTGGTDSADPKTVTANYVVADGEKYITVDATAGAIQITLPATSLGTQIILKRKDNVEANAVTVVTTGADTIEGSASDTLPTQGSILNLVGEAANLWGKWL